jgi:hypothetical protein
MDYLAVLVVKLWEKVDITSGKNWTKQHFLILLPLLCEGIWRTIPTKKLDERNKWVSSLKYVPAHQELLRCWVMDSLTTSGGQQNNLLCCHPLIYITAMCICWVWAYAFLFPPVLCKTYQDCFACGRLLIANFTWSLVYIRLLPPEIWEHHWLIPRTIVISLKCW